MIISIANQKGGTGKTTTSINLGRALLNEGKSVLLIDLDPQGSLSYSLSIDQGNTLSDLLSGDVSFEDIVAEREGMMVLPSDISLAEIELGMATEENRETILKGLLADLPSFDLVIIDCPPSLSLLTVNALTASDLVIIPMQMEVLSLQGLDLITNTIGRIQGGINPSIKVLGVLPVMVDIRRKLTSEVLDHIASNYDHPIFNTSIRPNVRASEAPSFGQSVIEYAPGSNSAQDYRSLAKEVLKFI